MPLLLQDVVKPWVIVVVDLYVYAVCRRLERKADMCLIAFKLWVVADPQL